MARRLPPLNSLKAFEAVARKLSFTLAANELNVTQAAVSHQVKSLEQYLQLSLFIRQPRKLQLTKEGKKLLLELSQCFDQMEASILHLLPQQQRQSIKVRMGSAFASKWMSPRLPEFSQQHPDIELLFNYSQSIADFKDTDIDLCITFGSGNWPAVIAYPLLKLDFFPVCSPDFIDNYGPIKTPAQLHNLPLLHDLNYYCWSRWLTQVGATGVDPERGSILDDSNVLMQAAIDGQGIAMGSNALIYDHLASGQLVSLFDDVFHSDWAYYLLIAKNKHISPSLATFRDWVLNYPEPDRVKN
ncbi:MAG: hypothetical protein OFPI_08170 [Osedax symbiont Rs2]|nr:MAG: hypothetical protein OFPI_08170 [Osedax symbiont Rs2]